MPPGVRDRKKLAAKSLWDTVVDFVIAKIGTILPFVGGAVITYLASVSKWLNDYGPFAWGAAGIAAFLILAVGFWIAAQAQSRYAQTRFARKHEESTGMNPLEDHFSKKRINLVDFFHPFYQPISAAKFQDCELFGPAVIAIMGSSMLNTGLNGCEAVIVKPNVAVIGATAFQNCTFDRCKFFRVTFLLTKDQFLYMKQQLHGEAMPVISDGTVGDL